MSKQELFNHYEEGNDMWKIMSMELAGGDFEKYYKYYTEYSIENIMELNTLKLVANYQERPRHG